MMGLMQPEYILNDAIMAQAQITPSKLKLLKDVSLKSHYLMK